MSIDRLRTALESGVPGCIWILRFDATGRAEPGSAEDIKRFGLTGEGYIWLHLDCVDQRTSQLLHSLPVLTPEAREVLGGAVDHQFVEHADGIVSGALVDYQCGIDGAKTDSDFLRFACGNGFVVTARRAPLYSAQFTRRALANGAKAQSPALLFEMLVSNLCDCSTAMSRDIAASLDQIEENVVIEGRGRDQRADLGKARRKTVRLARQVNGLHSTLSRLEEASDQPEHNAYVEIAASLGQRAESLARDVANLQDRARMLQDEINSILTLETNDRLYLLTVITAVLLPATFVTGYFGMNTKNLVFSDFEGGTFYATLICAAASMGTLLLLRFWGLATPSGANDKASVRTKR